MNRKIKIDYFIFSFAAVCIACCAILAFLPRTPVFSDIADVAVFEDPSGKLGVNDIEKEETSFAGERSLTVYRHRTTAAIWLRVRLREATGSARFLQIKNSAIEDIKVYFPGEAAIRSGKMVDSREIPIKAKFWTFPVPATLSKDSPVYIRVMTSSIMWLPLGMVSTSELITQTFDQALFYGTFFGMLIAIFFVNLFSFAVVRNRNFIIYVLYLLALIVYQLSVNGFLYFLHIPFAAQSAILWISLCGLGLFMMFFAKRFMDLKNTLPTVNLILDLNISLFVLQTFFALFLSRHIANLIGYITGLAVPIIIIASAIVLYAKGHKHFRFYLLALCAMLAGTLIWVSAAYIEARIPANYFFIIGTSVDTLLFTLAIFDQIKQELIEKEMIGEREKYYMDLSRTDALTGLYNRRYLNELIKRLGADEELPQISSLIMLDLDNFKTINDTYGHLIGDVLLTKTATKIKKHIRKSDIACRYGGDEFLIYLPGANASVAHSIADGIRRDILDDFSYSEEGAEIRHTISIGVTENRVDDTFDGLFLRADAALYQAKKTGRNKISIL